MLDDIAVWRETDDDFASACGRLGGSDWRFGEVLKDTDRKLWSRDRFTSLRGGLPNEKAWKHGPDLCHRETILQ